MTPNQDCELYWQELIKFCDSPELAKALRKEFGSAEVAIVRHREITTIIDWWREQKEEQDRRAEIRKLFWTGIVKTFVAAGFLVGLATGALNLWQILTGGG